MHLDLVNGGGGNVDITLDIGGSTSIVAVGTKVLQQVDIWVDAGQSLTLTGSSTGVVAYGFVVYH